MAGERPAGKAEPGKLKVFISYSRRDLAFADQLVAVLEWQGFQPVIDRKGIHGAEKWETRLGQLVLESNIVVFVLSPDSASSEVCAWEVDQALARGKPIVPVLSRPLEGAKPHEALRDLNYIHFYEEATVPGSGFGAGMVRLVEALSVDVAWLREHTRLEELAARWELGNRAADLLVRGSELAAFREWRERRPPNAPDLTPLQRAFLSAAEDEATARTSAEQRRLEEIAAAQAERQNALDEAQAALKREAEAQLARVRARRIIRWGSAAATFLLIMGVMGIAYQQFDNAGRQAVLAAEAFSAAKHAALQAKRAEEEAKRAHRSEQLAEATRREAQITQSGLLARAADTLFDSAKGRDAVTAQLLTLEGLPDREQLIEREAVSETLVVADRAVRTARERIVLAGHTAPVTSATFSADGSRLVTASRDTTARLWEAVTGKLLAILEGHTAPVTSAAFSADGSRIVTTSGDRTARLWETATGKLLATLEGHTAPVTSAAFNADDSRIVTASADTTARLWEAATGTLLAILEGHTAPVTSAAFSADGSRIVTASADNTARLWEAATGKLVATLEGHRGPVWSAAFSPTSSVASGALILTASHDKTARIWRVPFTIDALVKTAKDRAPRCLTQAQRKTYFLPPAPPLWCVERRLWPYHGDEWQAWLPKQKAWLAAGREGEPPTLPKSE